MDRWRTAHTRNSLRPVCSWHYSSSLSKSVRPSSSCRKSSIWTPSVNRDLCTLLGIRMLVICPCSREAAVAAEEREMQRFEKLRQDALDRQSQVPVRTRRRPRRESSPASDFSTPLSFHVAFVSLEQHDIFRQELPAAGGLFEKNGGAEEPQRFEPTDHAGEARRGSNDIRPAGFSRAHDHSYLQELRLEPKIRWSSFPTAGQDGYYDVVSAVEAKSRLSPFPADRPRGARSSEKCRAHRE
eukprot:scaffold442_cov268-Pinguiococcus_pyrenoidosus.AAC.14